MLCSFLETMWCGLVYERINHSHAIVCFMLAHWAIHTCVRFCFRFVGTLFDKVNLKFHQKYTISIKMPQLFSTKTSSNSTFPHRTFPKSFNWIGKLTNASFSTKKYKRARTKKCFSCIYFFIISGLMKPKIWHISRISS